MIERKSVVISNVYAVAFPGIYVWELSKASREP
jgi:hypothetical protein